MGNKTDLADNPSFTLTVTERSTLPRERIRIVQYFEDLRLMEIRRGIIYFFAVWSGPSHMIFRRITDLMGSIDSSLELVVVDIDSVPVDFLIAKLGGASPTGAGETLWIRDGTVVASVRAYGDDVDAIFLKYTREFL